MTTASSGERGPDPIVGSTLDKDYQVVKRIGVGGMGIVYLVEHTRLQKSFAAKVLLAELAANPEALRRFETEAKAASQLEHENIVTVTDYGLTNDGRPYIIMELLKGRTLDERIAEGRLSLEEIVAILVPVCRALACAHADGIVHRDVKPDNIFLVAKPGGRYSVKVLDFGIAKAPMATGRVTKHGQSIGSPHYMAPEACRGEDVDHRVDIYSVGVLMYLLFTGQVPFHDENFLKLLQMQVLAAPIPPRDLDPNVSEPIQEVILRAMSKDPDERYLSVDHLLRDFEQALPEGANEWLAETSRVSMPVPVVTGSSSSGQLPAYRTPIPGLKSPVAVHSVVTGPSKQIAAIPDAPLRSRAPIVIALLFLLAAGGGAAWYFTREGSHDNAIAATGEPAARPDPAPSSPPAPTTPTTTDPPVAPAKMMVHLRITTRPTRALIRLGDITLGRTPLEQTVEAQKDARLEVSADGYKPEVRKLALDSDQTLEIALDRAHVVEVQRPMPPPPHRPPIAKNNGTASGSSTPPPPPPSGELEIRDHR